MFDHEFAFVGCDDYETSQDVEQVCNEESQEHLLSQHLFEIGDQDFYPRQAQLLNSMWFDDTEKMEVLIDKIFEGCVIRPNSVELYLKLCTDICTNVPEFKRIVTKAAMKLPSNNMFFCYKWISQFPELVDKITSGYISDLTLLWFAPEIEKSNRAAFDRKILSIVSRTHENPRFMSFLRQTAKAFNNNDDDDDSSDYNWEFYKRDRELGINRSPIAIAIRYDDLDTFQDILTKSQMGINDKIPISMFERCDFVNNGPTLIQFAAFFGSKKIFKFLIMNNADLTVTDDTNKITLNHFAVAGGDIEIIRLCHCENDNMDGVIEYADDYYHVAIADWIRTMNETHE